MRKSNEQQTMNVSETPAEMSVRERRVEFNREILAEVLATHCRLNKMIISDECKLSVIGLERDYYGKRVEKKLTFIIRGD